MKKFVCGVFIATAMLSGCAGSTKYATSQLEKQVRREELLQKQYELEQKKLNRPLQEEINKKMLLQKQHELAMAELSRPTDELNAQTDKLNAQYNQKIAQDRLDNFDANTEALKLDREAGNAKNRQTLIDMQTAQEVAPLERELKKQTLEMQMAELDANKELISAQRELARRKTERELRMLDELERLEAIVAFRPQLEEIVTNHPGWACMTLDEQQIFLDKYITKPMLKIEKRISQLELYFESTHSSSHLTSDFSTSSDVTPNVYGPGIGQDQYGRPVQYEVPNWPKNEPTSTLQVTPNVYGPGVGQDQYGRPVKTKSAF